MLPRAVVAMALACLVVGMASVESYSCYLRESREAWVKRCSHAANLQLDNTELTSSSSITSRHRTFIRVKDAALATSVTKKW